jgi:hypothetical protein
MSSLEEEAVAEVARALQGRGWKQTDFDEPAFVLSENDEVAFRISLNQVSRDYGVAFFPALGVQHLEASRLVAQFKGRPRAAQPGASFGCSLADLLFEDGIARAPYERWLVEESAKVIAVVEVLLADITTYAMPFFRSLPTLDDIIRRLEQVPNRYEAQSGHLAVALALAGREPAAIDALAEFASFARGRSQQMAAQSQKFIDAFSHHFGIEEPRLPPD